MSLSINSKKCSLCGRDLHRLNRNFGVWEAYRLHVKRDYEILKIVMGILKICGVKRNRLKTAIEELHRLEAEGVGRIDLEVEAPFAEARNID